MGPPRRSPARGTGAGPIYGDFATLLQVLEEVPEIGKDRVGYTKYCGGIGEKEVYA